MAQYTGDFDRGTDGNTVQAADPGSATPWSDRGFSADGTLTYSSTQKYGALSCQSIFSATPSAAYVQWNLLALSGSAWTTVYGRIYMHHSGLPNSSCVFFRGFDDPAGSRAWEFAIDSSGFIVLRDNGGTTRGIGAVRINTGQWIRIELKVISSTTSGFMQARIYNNPDSPVITETITSSGTFSTLANTNILRIGEAVGVNASRTVYIDNIMVTDVGYPSEPVQNQISRQGGIGRW